MFVGDDFPELGADLVAALAALDVYEFAHDRSRCVCVSGRLVDWK